MAGNWRNDTITNPLRHYVFLSASPSFFKGIRCFIRSTTPAVSKLPTFEISNLKFEILGYRLSSIGYSA